METYSWISVNALMNSIVDRFDDKIKVIPIDDQHFEVTVTVDLSSIFYGCRVASEGSMKIIAPQKALDEFEYPPVTIYDIFNEVLEQVENFKNILLDKYDVFSY